MKNRVVLGVACAFLVCALLVVAFALPGASVVRVKVIDPKLKITDCQLVPWTGSLNQHVCIEHGFGVADYVEAFVRKHRLYHGPAVTRPNINWTPTPQTKAGDVLVLFGKFPGGVAPWGFDLVDKSGKPYSYIGSAGQPGMVAGGSPRRLVILTNTFAAACWIPTNAHGVFGLRLHDGTNDLAEVRLRQ